ncbi:hypothetical protein Patl1_16731 [Pistacia atlantica]|uniref:Uncharacterized protein n=1 Tax=Pistacia atlantica TaxID=434234 RepID=A0ACC1BAM2_9ROSI|nr:hypothetical protein Patl1_16731 [Pistacia atlantica]
MDSTSHNKPTKHHQASSSELLSSAKLMAEAAKSSFNHESDKVDKGRVAGAAANLLDAASHYGKLEEKSFGKYVEKAENYLHQYGSSHSTTTTTTANAAPNSAHHASPATAHSSFASSDDDGKSGSGYGDYFKMAEGQSQLLVKVCNTVTTAPYYKYQLQAILFHTFRTGMDSVSHDKSTKHHSSESKPTKKHQPSPSELLSSAKLVAEAAKSTLNHDSNQKVDKGKGQAENYLHKYGQKDSHSTTANSGHSAGTTAHSSSHHSDGHGKSGSGYGDYLKMAEGIFKKH